jgi:glycosyltransferase involved in cell wall biosynthesis
MVKEVLFFTASYPYTAAREHTFIDLELGYVIDEAQRRGYRVRVLPQSTSGHLEQDAVPPESYVLDTRCARRLTAPVYLLLDLLRILCSRRFWIGVWEVLTSPLRLRSLISWELRRESIVQAIEGLLDDASTTIVYSYWFDYAASMASVLRDRHEIARAVCRAHGWDVYEERCSHPLRQVDVKSIDRVHCVSENGARYLAHCYPSYAERFRHSYLGVKPGVHVPLGAVSASVLVCSCSSMIALKRVPLIAASLIELACRKPQWQVTWMHFGEGEERPSVQAVLAIASTNLKTLLPGECPHAEVLDFYRRGVHVFINASTSEGIPVSIMEALSYSIPVVATSVGGVPEAVDESCGVLVDASITPAELADAVLRLLLSPGYAEMRVAAHERWMKQFNGPANFAAFARSLFEA